MRQQAVAAVMGACSFNFLPESGYITHIWVSLQGKNTDMRDYRRRLAHYLRESRGEEGQIAFARRIGVSQSTLQRLEMAEQNVGLDMLEMICVRLHCEIGDLFPPLPAE
jgi:DNA-binding XRE family transcriptional regulator